MKNINSGGIGCSIFSSIARQNFGHDLRGDIFKKILNLPYEKISKFFPSTLLTRLTNDVSQAQELVRLSLRALVRGPFHCIGGIIMALFINLKLSIIIFISISLLLYVFYFITKKSINLFKIVQERIDRLNQIIRENLAGIRLVKIFNRSDYEKKKI